MSMLTSAFGIQLVETSGTIYIRADGSIEPSTANITSTDNVTYYFTDNNYDEIVVERDNIVVDGAGYAVQVGVKTGIVVSLMGRSNVTVKNMEINAQVILIDCTRITVQNINLATRGHSMFIVNVTDSAIIQNNMTRKSPVREHRGSCVAMSLHSSSNNTISGNNIKDIFYAFYLRDCSDNRIAENNIVHTTFGITLHDCSNNSIAENNVTQNIWGSFRLTRSANDNVSGNYIASSGEYGIRCEYSSDNIIFGNNITNNRYGIYFHGPSPNTISENYIAGNDYGIYFPFSSFSNKFHHNNFVNNIQQVYFNESSYANFWDDGYPSGGNYWSGHVCTGNPSNGSQPYAIDPSNIDNYPFQDPIDWLLPVATAGSDQAAKVNTVVSFDASGSSDNVEIVSYEWDFGDGTSGTGMTATHTYAQTGSYTVTLKVTDGAGNSDTDTMTVTSAEMNPLADFPLWTVGVAVAAVVGVAIVVYFLKVRRQ